MLLKIKEFADFCNISVRALHLYDNIDLFHPMEIDNNGYRYYDTEQMLELNTIISFKKVGFSLKDIKKMKDNNYTREDVILQLQQKMKENLTQIEELSYNNDNIETMLESLESLKLLTEDKQQLKQISKVACLANEKMEHDFSQIIWL